MLLTPQCTQTHFLLANCSQSQVIEAGTCLINETQQLVQLLVQLVYQARKIYIANNIKVTIYSQALTKDFAGELFMYNLRSCKQTFSISLTPSPSYIHKALKHLWKKTARVSKLPSLSAFFSYFNTSCGISHESTLELFDSAGKQSNSNYSKVSSHCRCYAIQHRQRSLLLLFGGGKGVASPQDTSF